MGEGSQFPPPKSVNSIPVGTSPPCPGHLLLPGLPSEFLKFSHTPTYSLRSLFSAQIQIYARLSHTGQSSLHFRKKQKAFKPIQPYLVLDFSSAALCSILSTLPSGSPSVKPWPVPGPSYMLCSLSGILSAPPLLPSM